MYDENTKYDATAQPETTQTVSICLRARPIADFLEGLQTFETGQGEEYYSNMLRNLLI